MPGPARDAVVVLCELCGDRLPTTRARVPYVAMDHILDEHRAWLFGADDERVKRMYRIITPKSPAAR